MEHYLEFDKQIGMLELNSEKITSTKEIIGELESLLILANLLGYNIEYNKKIYNTVNYKKFFIIDIYLPNNKALRLKLKLFYDEKLNQNKIINICFIVIPNLNQKYNNITNTYDVCDEDIIKAIDGFKIKL
jgi:hypothetical protein